MVNYSACWEQQVVDHAAHPVRRMFFMQKYMVVPHSAILVLIRPLALLGDGEASAEE